MEQWPGPGHASVVSLYYDHANVLDQLKAHLLSPALLTEWRFLSLKGRLAQIHQRWGVELRSPQTLANWYHRHGLTNKVAPYRVTCRYDDRADRARVLGQNDRSLRTAPW